MKKFAVFVAISLVASSIYATPARSLEANVDPIPLCSDGVAPPCIKSLEIKGAGLNDWTSLTNISQLNEISETQKVFIFDTAATGYSPESGYGTQVKLYGYGLTSRSTNYWISITSSNGTTQMEEKGEVVKLLDPTTEVRIKINTGLLDTQTYISTNTSMGSSRSFVVSDENHELALSGRVARWSTGYTDGAATRSEIGTLQFRGSQNSDKFSTWNGINIDTNAQSFGMPYFLGGDIAAGIGFQAVAPHFLTDGMSLNTGYYSSVLPASFLASFGLDQDMVFTKGATVVANYGTSEVYIDAIISKEPNGAIRIMAKDFHYSSPVLITKFKSLPQTANVGVVVKKGKKLALPIKTTQGITTSWKSTSPKICKVTSTKKTTKKKVGKKTVKTVTITKWQVQGKKKGTCTVVGTNSGNSSFGPASISKTIAVS